MHRWLTTALVCAGALVVAAWFGLGIHQAADQTDAQAIIASGQPSASQARHANRLLDSAGILNPDRQIDLDRSALLDLTGHIAAARRLALSVARAEPQNLAAWLAVGAAVGSDRRLELSAITHVLRLDPLH